MARQLMKVRVRGVVYESAKVAAQELGVNESTLRVKIWNGTEDEIGLREKPGFIPKPRNRKRLEIAGVTYFSHQDASAALGRSKHYVSGAYRLKDERPKRWEHVVKQFQELHASTGHIDT
ncbi:MAG: hypothetical protein CMP20_04170 [Rickettsiales bacterium]|nr:hypothetical protein [Rickettsiales bacterium]